MAVTFRANKDEALTYAEMDTNFGSFFYSSSVEGQELVLHYTSSLEVPINQPSHRINLLAGGIEGLLNGTDKRVIFFSGSSAFTTTAGFISHGGKVGIGVNETTDIPLTYELEVSGSIRASQAIHTNSDKRLKSDITPIVNGLEKVNSLQGVSFKWNGQEGSNLGVIAQDIQKVLPEVVSQDNNNYLSVNYSAIVPVLIEAIKELQNEINELKSKQ